MVAALHAFQFVAVILVLSCDAERPAVRQTPQAAPGRPGSAGLCLELESPRNSVQLGEPVSVIASLVNCSSDTQEVQDLLSPEYGFLQVWIQPPGGKELLQRPITNRDARGKPVRSLAPGGRLSAFAPVYFSPDGWVITQPGRYRVRAEYSGETTKLESKPAYVTVIPPENAAERRAAELMMSREAGLFLASGRDERGVGSRRLTALEQQYGQSRLAPYARLALAVAQSRNRFDPQTKTFIKHGCERAAEQLARAVREVRDPLLAATGTASWVRCLRELGREQDAKRAISMFFQSYPEARNVPTVLAPARRE
jgi:hypothetical protein